MARIKVKAAPGLRCPMQGESRRYITDSLPVEVELTSYYRRLLSDGSLVKAADAAPDSAQAPDPIETQAAKKPSAASAAGKER